MNQLRKKEKKINKEWLLPNLKMDSVIRLMLNINHQRVNGTAEKRRHLRMPFETYPSSPAHIIINHDMVCAVVLGEETPWLPLGVRRHPHATSIRTELLAGRLVPVRYAVDTDVRFDRQRFEGAVVVGIAQSVTWMEEVRKTDAEGYDDDGDGESHDDQVSC